MKLKKFRVKNYKSIIDSGDCYLTDSVTILAGKNESGKTSILEALEDFGTESEIRDEAKPIKNGDAIPSISVTFKLDIDSLKVILNYIGIDKLFSRGVSVEVIKNFPNQYNISEESKINLGIKDEAKEFKLQKDIEKGVQILKRFHEEFPQIIENVPEVDFNDLSDFENLIIAFGETGASNFLNSSEQEDYAEKFSKVVEKVLGNIRDFVNLQTTEIRFVKVIKNWIPNFILFNSFDDIFPNKIPFEELENNEWIKDLSIVSNLKVGTIKGADDRSKEKHKDDVNVRLNDDYEKFWTQDISQLSVSWDSEHLYFWIKEDGHPYEPSLRSKGRQWHLAFYIKVTARAQENMKNVILIDEPGLFLHAKAQKDILKKLEDSAIKTQLVFATHSPYLLESNKLNRIRLIHRTKEEGTKIENKIHALADKETLTPILTAIGLELSSGIAHSNKVKNVVVEGPSDLYYLEAFKRLEKRFENWGDINFVFGGGIGNMPVVGTILHGWGCKVLYLFDNDRGKKDGEKNLKNKWLVSKDLILSVIESKGAIEDIFDKDDFKQYILKDENIAYDKSNSEYIKMSGNDNVVSARLFLELIESGEKVDLSQETTNNISKLFSKINDKF